MEERTPSTASWRSGAWSGSTRSSWAGLTYPYTGQATGSPAGSHMDTNPSAPRGTWDNSLTYNNFFHENRAPIEAQPILRGLQKLGSAPRGALRLLCLFLGLKDAFIP